MEHDLTVEQTILVPSLSPARLWWKRFLIKCGSWEYWPMYIFNLPVLFIWLWNGIKARDLLFFTLANPDIKTGGLFGESKSGILQQIPDSFKPKTILVPAGISDEECMNLMNAAGLDFPLIAKPEVGERGWLISKIYNQEALKNYRRDYTIDIILQTYVDLPLEVSILVYRTPDGQEADVTSICEKHFLQVKGDGVSSIGQLILHQDRAVLQYEKLVDRFGGRWNEVLPDGEVLILEQVGNHCRGTMFMDSNHAKDDAIRDVMTGLLKSMPGMYYGRFDMRVRSWESLRAGQDIMVLEFNGVASEPAHIYQPGNSLLRAYRDIAVHWAIIRRISRQNRAIGYPPVTFRDLISGLILYFRYKRTN